MLSGNGSEVDLDEIKKAYTANAKRHPDVIQGMRTEQTVLLEFLETFEAHHSMHAQGEPTVSSGEWMEYYTDIGSAIDDDQYFSLMLQNTWDLKTLSSKKSTPKYAQK